MQLHFSKMHSLGNDFMVVDGVRQNFQPTANLIQQWSHRKTGIGFDQLLIVEARRNKPADYFYRIFNADGSEVAQCGNGARCLAKFIRDEKLIDRNEIIVETLAGFLKLKLESDGQVTVDLGRPIVKNNQFKVVIPAQAGIQKQTSLSAGFPLPSGNDEHVACVLSLGNPHCVFSVTDINTALVQEIGMALNNKHPDFPKGVNVGFMQVINKQHIKLRVYERGVGETLSCGSGACAAMIAGCAWNLLEERVTVSQPGGDAVVYWPSSNASVCLTGPAVTVFNGMLEI
jgi:diaminopimelate epimerase